MRKKNTLNGLLKGFIAIASVGFMLGSSSLGGMGTMRAAAANDTVSGQVTDASTGWPLYAEITISGTGYAGETIWTNPVTGNYSTSLPEGIDFDFNVAAWVKGYDSTDNPVASLTGDQTENFALSADTTECIAPGLMLTGFAENFDSATPPSLPAGWGNSIDFGTSGSWSTNVGTKTPSGTAAHSAPNLVYFNASSSSKRARVRLFRTAGINMTGLSATTLTFWMFHDSGNAASNDRLEVQVSTDAGATWSTVGDAIARYSPGPNHWQQQSVDLSAYASQTNLLLGFLGISELLTDQNGNVTSHGNDIHLDDIALGSPGCVPQAGGLVVGNVYNDTASTRMNGVTVSASPSLSTSTAATGDPSVGDGFYTLFAPAGSNTITAGMPGDSYSTGSAGVTVPLNGAVQQDFHLVSPALSYDPPTLQATVSLGKTTIVPFTITNNGGFNARFMLQEASGGGGGSEPALSPAKVGGVKGQGVWLARATTGIPVKSNQGGTMLAYPSSYSWTPDTVSPQHILVYADDLVYAPPNTYVDQALQTLGIAYTAHYNNDFSGFETDLASGKWDAVLFEGDNFNTPSTTLAALNSYVLGGGKLGIETWDMLNNSTNALYTTLGVAYAGNYADPTLPVYWWAPTSPVLNDPVSVPAMPSYSCSAVYSCGQYVDPVSGVSSAVAGYTTTPGDAQQAALILRNDGKTVFKAFSDRQNPGSDANGDGIKDVVALWVNITDYLLSTDFPWLSESPASGNIPGGNHQVVNITFDASAVKQAGEYDARLFLFSNDPTNRYIAVPVTMFVHELLYFPLIMR